MIRASIEITFEKAMMWIFSVLLALVVGVKADEIARRVRTGTISDGRIGTNAGKSGKGKGSSGGQVR